MEGKQANPTLGIVTGGRDDCSRSNFLFWRKEDPGVWIYPSLQIIPPLWRGIVDCVLFLFPIMHTQYLAQLIHSRKRKRHKNHYRHQQINPSHIAGLSPYY